MNKIDALKKAKTKYDLSQLLDTKIENFITILYVIKPSEKYKKFSIPKKSGGVRNILAPIPDLKYLQRKLSKLLQDCIEDLNLLKPDNQSSPISHGFVRGQNIITNAEKHINKKNILNLDLKDFFDNFNFGRVRGFFIKNKNFELPPKIATLIAQIACHENKLPQGSPCSPVITNLIMHSLDIRLAKLAYKNSCTYTRYADDITFSTRRNEFPSDIAKVINHECILGDKLKRKIHNFNLGINDEKTRIQYKDSRQDVTGLVVNKKVNIKLEYWRTVRSQCHSLFKKGFYTEKIDGDNVKGIVSKLAGKLHYIDQVDCYNRKHRKIFAYRPSTSDNPHLTSRENNYRRFVYYSNFVSNEKPTILCEGITDNIYLKHALKSLRKSYPTLINDSVSSEVFLINFFKYKPRTNFLLSLKGGTGDLKNFISQYGKEYESYGKSLNDNPVIIVLDNDEGFNGIACCLMNKNSKSALLNEALITINDTKDLKRADIIHVIDNLYIVLTPQGKEGSDSNIEDLFSDEIKKAVLSGKTFNPEKDADPTKEYGKKIFSERVVSVRNDIDFSNFRSLFDRIIMCIKHYNHLK